VLEVQEDRMNNMMLREWYVLQW